MPDLMIRHIDRLMAERIKLLAKSRQWSINDVVLQALRQGLGVSESNLLAETALESNDLSFAAGHWNSSERAAFQEAMQALAMARPEQLSVQAGELLE
ncbi:hypothetical protein [Dyella nitratireducens]|uniref:Uncharacterized protein n=1 Tax=Dyella nitratireducens TaxID=1849580 RepID=A0ABQ1FZ23_9GAMM|nr:hypothetical protein [Dyella nitratireducens]GGA32701.1 hypothetical protein GCM10010981_22300 [Dyella nitratireducens]GLQ42707.1 hypothetical protein GCM10007902_25570 [Dyella nitratireducens]